MRLMLASYDWSLGRGQQARLLLSEAVSLAGDIGLLPDYRAKRASSSISVAMAFEAESMGIHLRSGAGNDDQLDRGDHAEAVRRTTWSLFLLDTEYALGHHRSKLISTTDNFPPLPGNETAFVSNAPVPPLPGSVPMADWLGQQMPVPASSQLQPGPYRSNSFSTELRPPLTPTISSGSSNSSLPSVADDNTLCFYIHYVSLFHSIHVWAHSTPWRFVPNVFGAGLR